MKLLRKTNLSIKSFCCLNRCLPGILSADWSLRSLRCLRPALRNAKYPRKNARIMAHRKTATGSAPTSSRTNAMLEFFSTLTMSCRIRSRFFSRISAT